MSKRASTQAKAPPEAIDRGWHDFVHCDEATLRNSGFVDKDDTVCFRTMTAEGQLA